VTGATARLLPVAMALGVASCATERLEQLHVPGGRATIAAAIEGADPFPYRPAPPAVANHAEGEGGGYTVRSLRLPSVGDNGQDGNVMTVRYHERTRATALPLVVVLPIWAGHGYPQAVVVADLLRGGGVNVMRVSGEETVVEWGALGRAPTPAAFRDELGRMVERVRSTVIDVRRLLDWAAARPAVDPTRIAVVGFSESTLQAAGLMASDPRLAAAVLVMGGAHPHEILAACYGPPEAVRQDVLPRFGWTAHDLARAAAPVMRPIDPARLGSRLAPGRILLFEARRDDCIPGTAREALWEATGRPTRVVVNATHAGAFLGMTFLGGNHIRHRIVEFLDRALEVARPRPGSAEDGRAPPAGGVAARALPPSGPSEGQGGVAP
jgi:dienelactone hydrolase